MWPQLRDDDPHGPWPDASYYADGEVFCFRVRYAWDLVVRRAPNGLHFAFAESRPDRDPYIKREVVQIPAHQYRTWDADSAREALRQLLAMLES